MTSNIPSYLYPNNPNHLSLSRPEELHSSRNNVESDPCRPLPQRTVIVTISPSYPAI